MVNALRSGVCRSFFNGKKFSLHPSNMVTEVPRPTVPLVVLLPWLGASQSAISKYCKLYKKFGWDVVVKQPKLIDFLWPRTGLQNSFLFLNELVQNVGPEGRPLVIHSVSIGCYFYALLLIQFKRHPEIFAILVSRIKSQIIDSPVVGSLKQMALGVSSVTATSTLASFGLRNLMQIYFSLTKKFTVEIYDESIKMIKFHPPEVPSLILSSKTDKLALPEALDDLIKSWKELGIPTTSHIWADSEHAHHLKHHPELYEKLLSQLLYDTVGEHMHLQSVL